MNSFDKNVEMNLKMLKNDLILFAGITAILVLMSLMGTLFILLVPFGFLILISVILYHAYYILFYKTTFGDGAVLYNSFPVTVTENIWSKVFAAVFFQIAVGMISFIGIGIIMKFGVWYGMINEFLDRLEIIINDMGTPALLLVIADLWILTFMQPVIIYYFMIRFHKSRKHSGPDFRMIVCILIYVAINAVTSNMPANVSGKNALLIISVMDLAEILIMIIFYRLILKFYNKDFELSQAV